MGQRYMKDISSYEVWFRFSVRNRKKFRQYTRLSLNIGIKICNSDSDLGKLCLPSVDFCCFFMVGLASEVERAENFDCVEGYGIE